jgi:hypothetical protein
VFPCAGDVFNGFISSISLTANLELVPENKIEVISEDSVGILDDMFGVNLRFPLLFMGKNLKRDEENYFMVAPQVQFDHSVYYNLFRIRGGVHLGKLMGVIPLLYLDCYAGLSGVFIQDFTHDVATAGISPEIGAELTIFIISFRFQTQYEWYTDRNYNRFVFAIITGVSIPWL